MRVFGDEGVFCQGIEPMSLHEVLRRGVCTFTTRVEFDRDHFRTIEIWAVGTAEYAIERDEVYKDVESIDSNGVVRTSKRLICGPRRLCTHVVYSQDSYTPRERWKADR